MNNMSISMNNISIYKNNISKNNNPLCNRFILSTISLSKIQSNRTQVICHKY